MEIDDGYDTQARDERTTGRRSQDRRRRDDPYDDLEEDMQQRETRKRNRARRARTTANSSNSNAFFDMLRQSYDEEIGDTSGGLNRQQILSFAQIGLVGVLGLRAIGSFIFDDGSQNDQVLLSDGRIVTRGPVAESGYITYEGDKSDMLDAVVDLKVARSALTKAAALASGDRAAAAAIIVNSKALQPDAFAETCRRLAQLAPLEDQRHKKAKGVCKSIEESYDAVWTKANSMRQASMSTNLADVLAGVDELVGLILY
ncbi:hypothetical protein JKP88DRAFT_225312 [Tribonema minus]|uniref:Uncharacterized protein n=1 Tax=Tribonema minus TaxID=303371 RepID=A0A836CAX3_9STRA|nr:hypothetical protein JKP88DRAFT_225312 [Tribonema minus]